MVLLPQQVERADRLARCVLDFGRRPIARTIIDHDDFDLARVIGRRARERKRVRDHLLFIEGRDQDADRSGEIRRPGVAAETRRQPDHDQRSHDDQRRRDNHEGPEKFFDRVKDVKPGRC